MNSPIRLAALVVLVLASSNCNHRDSPFDAPTTPTPTPPAGFSEARPGVFSVALQPPAVTGPTAVRVTVGLTFVAPAGGVPVSLSSSDPALLPLPPAVVVPAGRDSAEVLVTVTPQVSTDRTVTVTANAAVGLSATANFSIWTILPTFFSLVSDPGSYVGGGAVRRLTPPYSTFHAWCDGNQVEVYIRTYSGLTWRAVFQAPSGVPLRVGTYEGMWPLRSGTDSGLSVVGEGALCARSVGRFTIREADLSPSGQLRKFWATFEQYCDNNMASAVRGDVRVTDGPAFGGHNCLQ